MEIRDIFIYIYIWYVRPHFVRKVGGVKCQPFLKRSNHWERALNDFQESGCFQFPEAVVTSTAKESLRSTEGGSLQVLAVL